VLYDAGGVSCFGSNRHGEMGVGGVTSSARPVPIEGFAGLYLSTWGDINGTDRAHTCAGAGALFCWGSNQSGELGTGDTMDRDTPARVVAPGIDFQDAVVGGGHTCARASDGALYCWGGNDRGQLGIGTTVAESSPTLVGAGPYEAVSLGRLHTCAISNGVLSCFGFNESGQLGIVAVRENQPLPVELETPGAGVENDWAEVSCGAWFTCARKRDGRVFCWGGNQYGNLGRVTATADAEVPGPVDGDLTFARIDCGRSHCCGLVRVDTTFDLYCWGRNEKGQLGTGDRADRFVPTRVGGDTRWSEHFSAGEEHTCAVREGGELACWGDNAALQLGVESATSRAEPSPVCP
jgi:alpha-tubulin suppressor-like RCC1 family protein